MNPVCRNSFAATLAMGLLIPAGAWAQAGQQPAGQSTLPQRSAVVHSAVQVFAAMSHDVQSLGQSATTQ